MKSVSRARSKITDLVSLSIWAAKRVSYIIIKICYVQFNTETLISLLYFIGGSWEIKFKMLLVGTLIRLISQLQCLKFSLFIHLRHNNLGSLWYVNLKHSFSPAWVWMVQFHGLLMFNVCVCVCSHSGAVNITSVTFCVFSLLIFILLWQLSHRSLWDNLTEHSQVFSCINTGVIWVPSNSWCETYSGNVCF